MSSKPQAAEASSAIQTRVSTSEAEAGRMEARMADLDVAHGIEARRLEQIVSTARKAYTHLKRLGER